MKHYDFLFEIILIGDCGVGKTSLLDRFVDDNFTGIFISTIGVDYKIGTVRINNKISVKLKIWDTAGQERFRTIATKYYQNAQCIIMVYDVTDQKSFDNISEIYLRYLSMYNKDKCNTCKFLVGNKSDKVNEKVVKYETAAAVAKLLSNCTFLETSAKSGKNVEELFLEIASELLVHPPPDDKNVKKNILMNSKLNIKLSIKETYKTSFQSFLDGIDLITDILFIHDLSKHLPENQYFYYWSFFFLWTTLYAYILKVILINRIKENIRDDEVIFNIVLTFSLWLQIGVVIAMYFSSQIDPKYIIHWVIFYYIFQLMVYCMLIRVLPHLKGIYLITAPISLCLMAPLTHWCIYIYALIVNEKNTHKCFSIKGIILSIPLWDSLSLLCMEESNFQEMKEKTYDIISTYRRIFEDIPQNIIAILFILQNKNYDDTFAILSLSVASLLLIYWFIVVGIRLICTVLVKVFGYIYSVISGCINHITEANKAIVNSPNSPERV